MATPLGLDEASCGANYLGVANRHHNPADLLKNTDRLADPLVQGAVRIFEASLGREHPNGIGVRQNLEILREETGE